jgi:excisionase family DNA binding protein
MSEPAITDDVPANDNADDVLDVPGVAELLRCGKDAVYASVGRNEIPHRRIGRHLRFSRTAVLRWLDSCGSQGAQKGQ